MLPKVSLIFSSSLELCTRLIFLLALLCLEIVDATTAMYLSRFRTNASALVIFPDRQHIARSGLAVLQKLWHLISKWLTSTLLLTVIPIHRCTIVRIKRWKNGMQPDQWNGHWACTFWSPESFSRCERFHILQWKCLSYLSNCWIGCVRMKQIAM